MPKKGRNPTGPKSAGAQRTQQNEERRPAARQAARPLDGEKTLAILRARAEALAAPRAGSRAGERVRLVVFKWRGQPWAVDSDLIEEVIPVTALTPLPGVPQTHLGLIHYRGEIYPVVDIGALFDIASGAPTKPSHAVLVQADNGAIAIAADALKGTTEADAASIAPMTSEGASHPALRGLAPEGAVLFDPQQLLDDARLIVNEQPVAAAGTEGHAA